MRFIDLFAGIGGFRIAMEQAGHKCVGFCEYDDFAVASYTSMHLITQEQREYLATLNKRRRRREILQTKYKNDEWYYKDIEELKGRNLPRADCWCFGSPCVSFSLSGLRAGLDGESKLIKEVFRLLRETREKDRPKWLIYENVKGVLSSNRGFDFFAILNEMDTLGYNIEWQLLNSADYIPQWRERVYIIGHLRDGCERQIFPIFKTNEQDYPQTISPNQTNIYFLNPEEDGSCHTIKYQYQKNTSVNFNRGGGRCASGVAMDFYVDSDEPGVWIDWLDGKIFAIRNDKRGCYTAARKFTPRECWRLQGISDTFFDRAEFVNSNMQLYQQAGNAVTIPVVYEIARRLE